ncbi:MAG: sugar nucleotide-binding protein, partial [Thermoplasmata archaeon]
MQKILVIGASGLVGSTAMRLGAGRYEMIGTYNTNPRGYSNLIKLDANNKKEILNIMAKVKPDLVLDTHAISDVDYCELHPDEA